MIVCRGVSLFDSKLEMYDDDDMDWEHRNVSVCELLRERESFGQCATSLAEE
jgi:hypothetical protein